MFLLVGCRAPWAEDACADPPPWRNVRRGVEAWASWGREEQGSSAMARRGARLTAQSQPWKKCRSSLDVLQRELGASSAQGEFLQGKKKGQGSLKLRGTERGSDSNLWGVKLHPGGSSAMGEAWLGRAAGPTGECAWKKTQGKTSAGLGEEVPMRKEQRGGNWRENR